MRTLYTLLATCAVLCASAVVVAQAPYRGDNPEKPKERSEKFDRVAFIKLQIKYHRTMADLLEEQIATEPDEKKIRKLSARGAKVASQDARDVAEVGTRSTRPRRRHASTRNGSGDGRTWYGARAKLGR